MHPVLLECIVCVVFADALIPRGKPFSFMAVMKLVSWGEGPLKIFFCWDCGVFSI